MELIGQNLRFVGLRTYTHGIGAGDVVAVFFALNRCPPLGYAVSYETDSPKGGQTVEIYVIAFDAVPSAGSPYFATMKSAYVVGFARAPDIDTAEAMVRDDILSQGWIPSTTEYRGIPTPETIAQRDTLEQSAYQAAIHLGLKCIVKSVPRVERKDGLTVLEPMKPPVVWSKEQH